MFYTNQKQGKNLRQGHILGTFHWTTFQEYFLFKISKIKHEIYVTYWIYAFKQKTQNLTQIFCNRRMNWPLFTKYAGTL